MKKIITVTGHMGSGKDKVVWDLNKRDDVTYIKPYTDRELPPYAEPFFEERYHFVLPTVMEDLMRDENVLSETVVNGHRYVFFEFQLMEGYNVLYADDYAVVSIKDNYSDVLTVRTISENESESDRVGEYLFAHEFDCLVDYDNYDFGKVEAML